MIHVSQSQLDLEVHPYINLVDNYMQLVPDGIETTIRGAFPVYRYTQNGARLYGVDITARYDFLTGGLEDKVASLSSNFSYVNGQDTSADLPLIDMPPAQLNTSFTWYNVLLPKLDFNIINTAVWEQNRFPDNDFIVPVPNDQGGQDMVQVAISQPPVAYSLWGAGVDYAFAKARLSLTTSNLFNTRYRSYLNRLRFYADDVGRDVKLSFIYKF